MWPNEIPLRCPISYKLTSHLIALGFEAIHVNDILQKSETKDSEMCKYADEHDYVIISKDADFRNSYFVKQSPKKLIKVNLGNVSNLELLQIFNENIGLIQNLGIKQNFLFEMDKDAITLIEL